MLYLYYKKYLKWKKGSWPHKDFFLLALSRKTAQGNRKSTGLGVGRPGVRAEPHPEGLENHGWLSAPLLLCFNPWSSVSLFRLVLRLYDNPLLWTSSTDREHSHHQPLKGDSERGGRTKGGQTHAAPQAAKNKQEGFRPCCEGCCFPHPEFTSFSFLLDKEPPPLSVLVVWEGWLASVPRQVWSPGFSQQARPKQLAAMTGVGTGTGPKIASDSATQDFGWISWNERRVYCCWGYLGDGAWSCGWTFYHV